MNYVPTATAAITVTPTAPDATAVITVNDTVVVSGAASVPLNLTSRIQSRSAWR